MKSLFFIFCGFTALIHCIHCSAETEIIRKNVESAIIANLAEKYGNNGTVNEEELKKLIDVIVDDGEEIVNETAASLYTDQIVQDCSAEGSLASCKHAIAAKCLNSDVISNIFTGMATTGVVWTDVFPLLVYQRVSNACSKTGGDGEHQRSWRERPSSATAWIYSICFLCAIFILSNMGICLSPMKERRCFERLVMLLVAIATGTLAGTGFMVLLPEAMEIAGADSPIPNYHYKMATALGGIYFFYMSEKFLKVIVKRKEDADTEVEVLAYKKEEAKIGGHAHSHNANNTSGMDDSARDVPPSVWLIMMGDALHSLIAGLAIGTAFSVNIFTGLSVGIAIVLEQLPHELGEITLLQKAGVSKMKAALYNFIAFLPAIVGMVIGVLLTRDITTATWIFAIAGGMFMYVSLVSILPEMVKQVQNTLEKRMESPLMSLIIQNVGLLSGFCIILVLIIYAD